MADRLTQISGHLSNTHGRGLLAGEVAIITGSGQGIGRSAAHLFAKEGAKVVITDIDAKKVETVVAEIVAFGGEAIGVAGDVAADDFPKRIVDATVHKWGKINHIVNNAGFTYDKMLHTMPDDAYDIIMKVHVRAPFRLMLHTMPDDAYDIIMKVHVRAPFRLVRAAAPHFRNKILTEVSRQSGENKTITNVSSTSGLHGNVGQANYAAAKAAVVGLTKTIAKEWGPFGVRANTIAFGLVHTRLTAAKEAGALIEIDGKKVALGIPTAAKPAAAAAANEVTAYAEIPLRRGATADEAAAAMLFLSSPLSSYVSGHTLEVTGGRGI
ncbi:hypothetical protein HWV62_28535 [Athelia sp. TMB]|nr:hypothetical protein HWV62_28535 [Athelia sp. TMB]